MDLADIVTLVFKVFDYVVVGFRPDFSGSFAHGEDHVSGPTLQMRGPEMGLRRFGP